MRSIKNVLRIAVVGVLGFSLGLAQNEREIRKSVPLKQDGSLFVDTYKGSVEVETWDNPQAEIYVRIVADERDDHGEEKVRDTKIMIEESSASVRIKTDYRDVRNRSSWFWGESGSLPFVHYRIKMPASASLEIKDYKSDLMVKDLNARIDLYTYKGTVKVKNLRGPVDLETYKGECTVEFNRIGESSFETYKGEIDLVIPDVQGFDVDVKLGRKADLHSDFELASAVGRSSRSDHKYRGAVRGGGPTIRLRSYKGTYRLRSN